MNFINDLIHMTNGELFIKYWWLWTIITIILIPILFYGYKKQIKETNKKYDNLNKW